MRTFTHREQRVVLLFVGIFVFGAGVLLLAPLPSRGGHPPAAGPTVKPPPPQAPSSPPEDVPPAEPTARINPNFASLEALMAVPGVGPALARRIVEYRGRNILFSADDLRRIHGIGSAKAKALEPYFEFSSGAPALAGGQQRE